MSALAVALQRYFEKKSLAGQGEAIRGGSMMLDAEDVRIFEPKINTLAPPDAQDQTKRWLDAQIFRGRREGMFVAALQVTPTMAALLLEQNPNNRPLSAVKLADYKRDMLRGAWALNGETIIIADTGELNDGQHRLIACRDSGASFETQVVFGAPRDTRDTVDLGLKRTVGHVLSMGGHANANQLAHAVKLLIFYEKHATMASRPDWTPTAVEIKDWIADNGDLAEHFKGDAMAVARKFRQSRGLFAALQYLTQKCHPLSSQVFWTRLFHGDNLSKNDPINRLRDRLIEISAAKGSLPPQEIAALVIKAWNLFRRGRTLGQGLRWRTKGNGSEPFPIAE